MASIDNKETRESRATDNYWMDFPAKMQDGRGLTDWKSSCIMNEKSLSMDTYTYRNYLTNNALGIMKNNTKIINELGGCGKCSDYSVIPPYLSLDCNEDKCIQKIYSETGLGAEINTRLSEDREKKINNMKNVIKGNTGEFRFQY
jgi:hypothetical protein